MSSYIDMAELAALLTSEYDINIGRNNLCMYLRREGVFLSGKLSNLPARKYIQSGKFKVCTVKKGNRKFIKPLLRLDSVSFIVEALSSYSLKDVPHEE